MLTSTRNFKFDSQSERMMDRHVPQFRELLEIWLLKNHSSDIVVQVSDVNKAVGWAHRIANEDEDVGPSPSLTGTFESLRSFRDELAGRI